ncbi:MAG: hypothetical protein CFE44_14310 [Burkholderiales bacterium PBB4]|nr:MAG: hypothetical protein CFE44_14310 [Burkholderiales bacterium PBB4]
MNHRNLWTVPLLLAMLSACGPRGALWQAEQSCLKYPTPGARADCEYKARDDHAAFVKESQKSQDQARAKAQAELEAQEPAEGEAKREPKKKNELCFKRASGETVCPN